MPADLYAKPHAAEMARLAKALAAGGNRTNAIRAAEAERAHPRVMAVLKDATPAASLGDPAWASTLEPYSVMSDAFISGIRERTLFYRVAAMIPPTPLRARSFAVALAEGINERGEGEWLPVLRMTLNDTPLDPVEAGAIVVMTNELARSTSPEAFSVLRAELERAAVAAVDRAFWRIASDGVTAIPGTADPLADLRAALNAVATTAQTALIWALNPVTANAAATAADASGSLFPALTPTGGLLLGIPVAVGDAVPPGTLALLDAAAFAANPGSVAVDQSDASALRMRTDPEAAPAMVSLFQTNATAIRVLARFGAAKRTDKAIALIEGWLS